MDLGETSLTMVRFKLRKPHDIDNMNVHPCKNEIIRNESVSAILIKLFYYQNMNIFVKALPNNLEKIFFVMKPKRNQKNMLQKFAKPQFQTSFI